MKTRFTPRSRQDIKAVHDWIAEHNAGAATAVVAQIRKTAALLERHPAIGRLSDLKNVRVLSVVRYPYVIYHSVKDDEVVILHVRHTSRSAPAPEDLSETN